MCRKDQYDHHERYCNGVTIFSKNLTCILFLLNKVKIKMINFLLGSVLNKQVPCHLKTVIYRL